jgi:hypothetical protein
MNGFVRDGFLSCESSGSGISVRNLLSLGCDKVRSGDLFRTEVGNWIIRRRKFHCAAECPKEYRCIWSLYIDLTRECFPCTPVAYTCCFKVYYQPLYTDVRHSHVLRSSKTRFFSERTGVVFRFLINRLEICRCRSLKRGFVFWFMWRHVIPGGAECTWK